MSHSHTIRRRSAALLGAALLIGAPAVAFGQAASAPGTLPANIASSLAAAGYTAIHDVELDDGVWELEATSPAGKPVDLKVDPNTGKVLHEEPDDD